MYLDTVSTKALGSDIEYPLQSNALSAKSILGGRVALTLGLAIPDMCMTSHVEGDSKGRRGREYCPIKKGTDQL